MAASRRITEEDRALILKLHAEKGWGSKQIAQHLKGTANELEDWAVGVVLATANYRDK